ncbi:MAG: carboxypeptidase regulatory-like domain-containing protein, partial [Acidimicrobiia bacterium]
MTKRRNLLRTRLSAVALAVVTTAATVGLVAMPAAAAPSGSISGQVVDGDGNPLSGICVQTGFAAPVQTDLTGAYSLTGLDTGAHQVQYSDCNPSPVYATQWYQGRTDPGSADPVTVNDGFDTLLADAVLAPGIAVRGTVTDGNGAPLPNVSVNVNPAGPGQAAHAQSAVDGTYTTGVLPAGSYRVQFWSPDPHWVREYWNDRPTWGTADTLVLAASAGPVHGGIDAQLTAAATVEGTVTGTGGVPLAGICVDANVPNGGGGWDGVGTAQTAGDGTYSMGGLPGIEVRVRFHECGGGPSIEQWYNAQTDFQSATPIALTPGAVEQGVDAQLSAGVSVSGTVTDGNGTPIQFVNVVVQPTDFGPGAATQTDAGGNYTTSGLPPGDYRVQFQSTGAFAGEYWNDKVSQNDADILTISVGDGPVHGGIDATLAAGASVSGRVTDPIGQPASNVCVDAVVDSSNGIDGVGGATTAPDGTYTISGLPPTTVKFVFRDCNGVGPYVQEWWNDVPDPATATPITLAPGEARTGVDAQLAAAGGITGTVTDDNAQPLEGICAQATTPTFFGGLARTDSNGEYQIVLARPGDYRVQFVDCRDTPMFAAQWSDGQASAATAQVVPVAAGQVVGGIDAALVPGATGSISGKALTARGTAMTTACALAYLPDQLVLFGLVQPDGTYTIPNVPSGTYALAFVGCHGGDPQETVPDPDVAGVSYSALWWDGVPLTINAGTDGGPDPIVQGATLVTVTPGANLTGHDVCFGCGAIDVTSITPSTNALAFSFTPPDLDVGASGLSASVSATATAPVVSASAALAYTATCTPRGGGAPTATSGSGSPIA